jgi:hypothetical protein
MTSNGSPQGQKICRSRHQPAQSTFDPLGLTVTFDFNLAESLALIMIEDGKNTRFELPKATHDGAFQPCWGGYPT